MPPNAPSRDSYVHSSNLRTLPSPPKRRPHTSPGRSGRGNAPTSFFLRSEEDMNKMSTSGASPPQPEVEDSVYGVRSLDSSASYILSDGRPEEHGRSQGSDEAEASLLYPASRSDSPFMPELARRAAQESGSIGSSPIPPMTRLTGLLTPLLLRSPQQGSTTDSVIPSTPKSISLRSLRLSDDEYSVDEATSQALTSSGEEEDEEQNIDATLLAQDHQAIGSAPQLVMPSIRMPSRRPFTDRGKSIGKLKIIVAGARGKVDSDHID